MTRKLENSRFGAFVIRAVEEGGRTCENGLPFVSPSIRMLGRFQRLKNLEHDNLCRYLELFRCSLAKNLVILTLEHNELNLKNLIETEKLKRQHVVDISRQIVSALKFLHLNNLSHGNFTIEVVQIIRDKFSNKLTCRLSNYALGYITNNGSDSELIATTSTYSLSPEQFLSNKNAMKHNKKSDIWSFGIILFQLYTGILFEKIWNEIQYRSVVERFCSKMINDNTSPFETFLKNVKVSMGTLPEFDKNEKIEEIINRCLHVFPSKRVSINVLQELIEDLKTERNEESTYKHDYESIEVMKEKITHRMNESRCFALTEMQIEDAFFLWKICGASCENILLKKGVIKLRPPIATLPHVVIEDFVQFGNEESRSFTFNNQIVILPDSEVFNKISKINVIDLLYSFSISLDSIVINDNMNQKSLEVVVKEKDVVYQTQRINKLRHILDSIHFNDMYDKLVDEARYDIPPMLRSRIWRALLNVDIIEERSFFEVNTMAPHSSDRQLDVDIPRCHQYEDMMTSPSVHVNLRRVLKGWLLTNEDYVYWQGCDSLAAPFLMLNLNKPETALSCLNEFIKRYLFNFFLRDNSAIIQEYLAVFNHLLAYTDAPLYSHLSELGFFPELYAIPWFLTCFAHVLPMYKLYHIWDQILLHDSSFPLLVGLAVMKQLRPRLIKSTFNDAILLFSDLPDLPIDKIIETSLHYYKIVPPSCTFRVHDSFFKGKQANLLEPPYSFEKKLSALSVNELKQIDCPRMSLEEFNWRALNNQIAVIDVRPSHEFFKGCVMNSTNYPNIEDDSFRNIASQLTDAQENFDPICIVGGKDVETVKKFSSKLVKLGINGVCVLSVGFDEVRDNSSLIIVPR